MRAGRNSEESAQSSVRSSELPDSASFVAVRSFITPPDLKDILSNYNDFGCTVGSPKLTLTQIAWPCGMCLSYCVLLLLAVRYTICRWEPPLSRDPNGKLTFTNIQFAHTALVFAFGVSIVLGVFDFLWAREKVKKHTSLWVSYVNGLAFLNYSFLAWNGIPFMNTPQGEVNVLRLLLWLFSTPGMINITACLVSHRKRPLLAELSATRILRLSIFADVMMIVFGLLERCLMFPWHQISFFISMVSFGWTLRHLKVLIELSTFELAHAQDRKNLVRVHTFTVGIWFIFPLLRMCQLMGLLSNEAEEIGNTMLDLAAKLVYTVCLMVVNFTLTDQVLVDRLKTAQDYLDKKVERNVEREMDAISSVAEQHKRKLLAYREAESWRAAQVEKMQRQGYPEQRAAALLDSTLSEYIALSSGNISAFLRDQNAHDD